MAPLNGDGAIKWWWCHEMVMRLSGSWFKGNGTNGDNGAIHSHQRIIIVDSGANGDYGANDFYGDQWWTIADNEGNPVVTMAPLHWFQCHHWCPLATFLLNGNPGRHITIQRRHWYQLWPITITNGDHYWHNWRWVAQITPPDGIAIGWLDHHWRQWPQIRCYFYLTVTYA